MQNKMSEKSYSSEMLMDSIHGAISLFEHEIMIIDHPLFQRQRFISQNDVLQFTFMGSTHTRFSHSIGALHVAQRMFKQIITNKIIAHERATPGFKISDEQNSAVEYLCKCLRLAVLMHDTGHGAFSHQAEKSRIVKGILEEKGCFEALWQDCDISNIYTKSQSPLYHEHYSVRAAYEIMKDVEIKYAGINYVDVLNIMETTDGLISDKFKMACDSIWSLFTEKTEDCNKNEINKHGNILNMLRCILSGEFDADKADYLLRDSMHSGANLGKFDLDALINSLGASWIEDEDSLRLTISKKGIGSLEDMIFSRFQMYSHVYNHKTVNGVELQLHLSIDEILSDDKNAKQMHAFMTDINEFAYLTDCFFWEKFRERARADKNSACYGLINRIKIPFLGTFKDMNEKQIEEKKLDIAISTGIDIREIHASTHTARFSKINNDFKDIMIEIKDPITMKKSFKRICEVSDFFEKFSNMRNTSFHRRRIG